MQYQEALDRAPFSEKELLEMCVKANTTPKEFMKKYMKMRSGLTDWRIAHREFGTLVDVERKDLQGGAYSIVCTYATKESKYGKDTQTGRTKIIQNDCNLYETWHQLIGQPCVFYISYQENKEDGSVYRMLMDVEPSNAQAPTPFTPAAQPAQA